MKKVLIYLSFLALLLVLATPVLAQTSQEDPNAAFSQYGPIEDPCADLSGPNLDECLIESYPEGSEYQAQWSQYQDPSECDGLDADPFLCDPGDARHVIPEANKSSNQTFDSFSNTLKAIRSSGQNEVEAKEVESSKHSSQPGSGEPDGSGRANEAESKELASKDADAGQKAAGRQDSFESKSKDGVSSANETSARSEASARDNSHDAVAATTGMIALPETSGGSFVLICVGGLLLAGGITAVRLFR